MLIPKHNAKTVRVFLVPDTLFVRVFQEGAARIADRYFSLFEAAGEYITDAADAVSAAEQVFDLTNNPDREVERAYLWGSRRSLSVGDIVSVDGELMLCCPMGWEKFDLSL